MADKKKTVEQEDKVLAAEKHVDELVQVLECPCSLAKFPAKERQSYQPTGKRG